MKETNIIPDTWETKVQSARQHLFRIAMLSLCIGSNPLTLKRPIGIERRGEGVGG